MIRDVDILNAINLQLVKRYKKTMVYRDVVPQDFERPSFFIFSANKTVADASITTIQVLHTIVIQCVDRVDAHYEADTDRLAQMSDSVVEMFSHSKLPVGDRSLTISDLSVERSGDVSDVKMVLSYFDERTTRADHSPVMGEIILNKEHKK